MDNTPEVASDRAPEADVQAMQAQVDAASVDGVHVPEVQKRQVGRGPDYAAIGQVVWRHVRQRAAWAVQVAVQNGALAKVGGACADCGEPATAYDHRDYGRPLDVVAVCRQCNYRRGVAAFDTAAWIDRVTLADSTILDVTRELRAMAKRLETRKD